MISVTIHVVKVGVIPLNVAFVRRTSAKIIILNV